ncbi:MAG: 16S rRNA processing protein RimM [Deltaproteobacteria bacterium]|nr:16S rRNA processing protein RimM [Deltaproteobacteria bacterium]
MRSLNKDGLVPIGKIIGAHGIKGEVKVFPYGELEDFELKTVLVSAKEAVKSFTVKRVRKHKDFYILELEGVSVRNDAEALIGAEVRVPKDDLPELDEDEYYYMDLVGMDVMTDEGKYLGSITNVIATGSNDVLEVDGPFGSVLIPALDNIIIEVDAVGRKVTVRLMEGLLPGETEQ